jgi:hypothetical protein
MTFLTTRARHVLAAIALLSGCASAGDASDEAIGTVTQPLNYNATLVAEGAGLAKVTVRVFDDAGASCTGVIVGARHVLTAAHCMSAKNGAKVGFYNGPIETGDTRTIVDATAPDGVTLGSQTDLADDNGKFADIAVLKLDSNIPSYAESALLPTRYPGNNASGVMVGTGLSNNVAGWDKKLRRVSSTTYSSDPNDGHFLVNDGHLLTDLPIGNFGDSGGPFLRWDAGLARYVVHGILSGAVDEWATWKEKYTSTSFRVAWLLDAIEYTGGMISIPNKIRMGWTGVPLIVWTNRVCSLECVSTVGCVATSFVPGSCFLLSSAPSPQAAAGWTTSAKFILPPK